MSYRTLGLTVPISEVLDPKKWRERYAYNLLTGSGGSGSSRSGAVASVMCPGATGKKAAIKTAQDEFNNLIGDIPDETIKWHLRVALSELETKLGIPMGIVRVKSKPLDAGLTQGQDYERLEPRRPYTHSQHDNWLRVDLPPSVISIERVRLYWFGTNVWEISPEQGNTSLVHLEWPDVGSAHILPNQMTNLLITSSGLAQSNYGAFQLLMGAHSHVPDVWAIDYTLGPLDKQTRTPMQIEAVLAHWVYCVATILLLSMSGLARSQGLSSSSLSLDGLSKSISLQASAIYGINSALENALENATKRIDWKALKLYKRGLKFHPFGY